MRCPVRGLQLFDLESVPACRLGGSSPIGTQEVIVLVEVFTSPGCSSCSRARAELRDRVAEMDDGRVRWCEANILDEFDHAVDLGAWPPMSRCGIAMRAGPIVWAGR